MTHLPHTLRPRYGFTLVELAIVMVIIALIAGGIMGGQNLMRAAKIRGTVSQITEIRQSTLVFYDQYMALPGDMPNATSVWSAAVNGNGDGLIESFVGATSTNDCSVVGGVKSYEPECPDFDGERSQFFYQLGLAGLTANFKTTVVATTPAGESYPAVKMRPGTGMIATGPWLALSGGDDNNIWNFTKDKVYLFIGVCNPGQFGGNESWNDCAIFTPTEAWDIDRKIDDGKPLAGKTLGQSSGTPCVTANEYNLDIPTEAPACNLMYSIK